MPKYSRTDLYKPEEIQAMLETALQMKLHNVAVLISLSAIFGKRLIENLRLKRSDIITDRHNLIVTFNVAKKKRKRWDTPYGVRYTKKITLKHPLVKYVLMYLEAFDKLHENWDNAPIGKNWVCTCGAIQVYGRREISEFTPLLETPIKSVNQHIKTAHPKCWKCGKMLLPIKHNPWLFEDPDNKDKEIRRVQKVLDKMTGEKVPKLYTYQLEGLHMSTDRARYLLKKVQPDAYFHLFRVGKATSLANRGCTEYQLMTWLDHDDPKVSAMYVRKAGVSTEKLSRQTWIT
jgi:hypothetical protein